MAGSAFDLKSFDLSCGLCIAPAYARAAVALVLKSGAIGSNFCRDFEQASFVTASRVDESPFFALLALSFSSYVDLELANTLEGGLILPNC